jgi:eukaryotic-like serine/threonine-protein kinase
VAALRGAIRLQPDFAGAHNNLAAVLRQTGDAEGAAAESRAGNEIMKRQTDQQAAVLALRSAEHLMNGGDLDGAISQFRAALIAAPENAKAHYELGLTLKRKGDLPGAAQEFDTAHRLDPRFVAP